MMVGEAVSILGGVSVAIAAGVVEMIRPSSPLFGPVHWHADPAVAGARYALTFDDGPTDPSTAAILDILGELNARATFFVVGANVQRFPKLVERMQAEGHLVANHSFDHPYFGMLRGPWYWRRQIGATDDLIESIIGKRSAMFRPPMGVKQWFICGQATRAGHAVITWSRRARDGVTTSCDAILNRLVPSLCGGEVLLLHDGIEPHSRRDPGATIEALRPLVRQLRDLRGLQPAPLDELLTVPAYRPSSTSSPSLTIGHGPREAATARG